MGQDSQGPWASPGGQLPEGWGEEGAQGAWAILPFPREEAPGLFTGRVPSLNPILASPVLLSAVEGAGSEPQNSALLSTFYRDPAFLSGRPEPQALFPGGEPSSGGRVKGRRGSCWRRAGQRPSLKERSCQPMRGEPPAP